MSLTLSIRLQNTRSLSFLKFVETVPQFFCTIVGTHREWMCFNCPGDIMASTNTAFNHVQESYVKCSSSRWSKPKNCSGQSSGAELISSSLHLCRSETESIADRKKERAKCAQSEAHESWGAEKTEHFSLSIVANWVKIRWLNRYNVGLLLIYTLLELLLFVEPWRARFSLPDSFAKSAKLLVWVNCPRD